MTIKKFEFKKTYEEFEAAGKTYRMYFDDEKLQEYRDLVFKYKEEFKDENFDVTKMSKEEYDQKAAKQKATIQEMINTFLGKGSYDELYEASGRSIHNMADLLYFLIEFVEHRTANTQNEKVYNYYKKAAKK
ncbi:hypothetical protein P4284_16010 [Bacillus swezeyi]|uniref:hypothetical protein n=1 Tax=Bacillus swezeyi TaxID=1925020 RepID=UPI002E1ECAAA|nr:hypothetical protein [Bacillus swezeyi]